MPLSRQCGDARSAADAARQQLADKVTAFDNENDAHDIEATVRTGDDLRRSLQNLLPRTEPTAIARMIAAWATGYAADQPIQLTGDDGEPTDTALDLAAAIAAAVLDAPTARELDAIDPHLGLICPDSFEALAGTSFAGGVGWMRHTELDNGTVEVECGNHCGAWVNFDPMTFKVIDRNLVGQTAGDLDLSHRP